MGGVDRYRLGGNDRSGEAVNTVVGVDRGDRARRPLCKDQTTSFGFGDGIPELSGGLYPQADGLSRMSQRCFVAVKLAVTVLPTPAWLLESRGQG